MKNLLIFLSVLIPTAAFGAAYVRQHSDTIVSDRKILASDLSDEFNAIVTSVNGIDSSNITDGSLTATDFAATSTAVTLNKKAGCDFSVSSDGSGVKSVDIKPPCEVFMDGLRGFITATESISLISNLSDGGIASKKFFHIYAQRSGSDLNFHFSEVAPTLATARKRTVSTDRYIGTVRTCDSTHDIVRFRRAGANRFQWVQGNDGSGNNRACASGNLTALESLIATLDSHTVTGSFTTPNTFESVMLRYRVDVGTPFNGQCEFGMNDGVATQQIVVIATGGNVGMINTPVDPADISNARIRNIDDCNLGGDLRVVGWEEPYSLHQ